MTGRLLVLDDEPDIRLFIRRVAELAGFEVRDVDDPDAFLDTVQQWQPTHIVLDLVMPDRDGLDLLTTLCKSGCKARIVVISGYASLYLSTAKRLAAAYGVDALVCLEKPFDVGALTDALN